MSINERKNRKFECSECGMEFEFNQLIKAKDKVLGDSWFCRFCFSIRFVNDEISEVLK